MEKFFHLKENGTTVSTEIMAGLTTFFAMSYIIIVNPQILSSTGMPWGGVFLATIIAAIIGTLVMGLFANVPYAQAAGMGLNAFFTYTVCFGLGFKWQETLCMVFLCGLINIIITVTKIRKMIIQAIPEVLQNAIGGGIGASVIISQHFGAKRFARMKSAVYTALLTFLAVSVLLAGVGLLCSEQIMTALKTPPDALEIAVTYLNIYFYGLPFLFLYNILSSLFNALGKSRIPLYFLIFSSLLNVVLDWYFVAVLHRGVPGAAYATFLAQGLSAVLSFGVFLLELRRIPERSNGLFRFGELRAMTRVALPSILQQSTVSIGMMLVQSVVNGFGTQILAGFSAAARIESLCIVPMAAISNALSSYTAQNIGAEKPERVPQGYRAANRMIVLISVLLCVLLELFRTPIIAMFLDAAPSPETVATGEHYLQFIGFFFCFIGFKMAVDGILRGAGDVKMFTIANLVNLAIRVLLSWLCAPLWGVEIVWYAVPVGWLANFVISFAHYRTGKWKEKRIA